MEELKEKIARAIIRERYGVSDPMPNALDQFQDEAKAVLRAIEEAGFTIVKNEPLPCDVKLPPATTISSGCTLSTLLAGLEVRRKGFPEVSAEQIATVQRMLKAEFDDGDWETVESEAAALNLEEPRG